MGHNNENEEAIDSFCMRKKKVIDQVAVWIETNVVLVQKKSYRKPQSNNSKPISD